LLGGIARLILVNMLALVNGPALVNVLLAQICLLLLEVPRRIANITGLIRYERY
jgi:hypothetical protein